MASMSSCRSFGKRNQISCLRHFYFDSNIWKPVVTNNPFSDMNRDKYQIEQSSEPSFCNVTKQLRWSVSSNSIKSYFNTLNMWQWPFQNFPDIPCLSIHWSSSLSRHFFSAILSTLSFNFPLSPPHSFTTKELLLTKDLGASGWIFQDLLCKIKALFFSIEIFIYHFPYLWMSTQKK